MAAPSAIFQYGANRLAHPVTEMFDHVPVYDPSGTDYLYTRFTLKIRGILADQFLTGSETAAQFIKRIEHDFLSPRQYLLYSQNGKTILEIGANANGDYLDAENGPKPQSFNVVLMTQTAITVEFTVVVCKIDCSYSSARQRGYTSNRWSETEEYNECGYCSLTTRGVLICASDLRQSPDQLRGIVAPVIRRGYQRERSSYTLSEDGLRLNYVFLDREYYAGPPYPAKRAEGKFVLMQTPGQWTAFCNVTLEGQKDASKRELMHLAHGIALAKLRQVVPTSTGKSGPIILNATHGEHLYRNIVEVSFRCGIDPRKLGTTGTGARLDMFGNELPGSPSFNQPGIAPPLRGNNQFLTMLAAAFDDPCVVTSILANGGLNESQLQSTGTTEHTLTASNADMITRSNELAAKATQLSASTSTSADPSGRTIRSDVAGGRVAQVRPATPVQYPPAGTNPAGISVGKLIEAKPAVYVGDIPYANYKIKISYIHSTGKKVMPATWSGATNKKVRLHNNTLRMIVEWSAERVGEPPELPDPCPDDCNYVLEHDAYGVDGIEPVIGAGFLHSVSGRYEYGVIDTTLVPLAAPLPPFIVAEVRQKVDPATGRLQSSATTDLENQIAALNERIAAAEGLIALYRNPQTFNDLHPPLPTSPGAPRTPSPVENPEPGKFTLDPIGEAARQKAIDYYQNVVNQLTAERDALMEQAAETRSTATKRRREGDYVLNSDLIWFRLKTLKPGDIFEDCPCEDGSATLSSTSGGSAELIGSGRSAGATPGATLPTP